MRHRLMTPGPTPVPEETLLELARPAFYHRSVEFRRLHQEVHADLQYLFCTAHPVFTLTASGTGGMEAALGAVPTGAQVLCLIAGKWGERWRNLALGLGLQPLSVTVSAGKSVQPEQLASALRQHPDVAAVCATFSDTATGVRHDLLALGQIVRETSALFLVDSISGLGVMECRTDEWAVDINVTSSQKALMMPPGLAFVSVSPKAWACMESNPQQRSFYFDLRRYREALKNGDTPFTPANTLIRALRVSLKKIRAEGLENLWARHARVAAATRAGIQALGLRLLAEQPADGLTVFWVPEGMEGNQLLTRMEEKYGVRLAGGQDQLKGKVLRLAHMGYIDVFDVLASLSALELTLLEMGYPLNAGVGVAAFQRMLASNFVKQNV